MKNISTFQMILLVVFGALLLGGVFVMSTYSGGKKGNSAVGKVVIWGTLPSQSFRTALDDIAQQNQDMKEVSYVYKNPTEFDSILTTAIASGDGPDLILIPQTHLASLRSVLTPIPYTSFSQRDFLNAFADVATVYLSPSGSYGIPLLVDPLVLYYNRSLLSSESIVRPPRTWDELSGLVPLFTKKTASGGLSQVLIPLGTYDNVHDAMAILSTLFMQAGVPIVEHTSSGEIRGALLNASGVSNTSGTGSSAGADVLDFYTQFADPTKTTYNWNNTLQNAQQMFLAGNSALYIGYASEAKFLTQANPNLSFDVASVPQSSVSKIKTVYAKVYAFSLPHGSANMQGAVTVASKLSNASSESIIAKATGLTPVLRSLLSSLPSNPTKSTAYSAAIMSRTWLSPSKATTQKIFSGMINEVNAGQLSIPEALTRAAQAITATLQ